MTTITQSDLDTVARVQAEAAKLATRWIKVWPSYSMGGWVYNVRVHLDNPRDTYYAMGCDFPRPHTITFFAQPTSGGVLGSEIAIPTSYLLDSSTLEADSLAQGTQDNETLQARYARQKALEDTPEVREWKALEEQHQNRFRVSL